MSGLVRDVRFFEGDALDLRKVREAFYLVASRLRELQPEAFRDGAFDKTSFEPDSFEEFYGQYGTAIHYKTPMYSGLLVPFSNFTLVDDDAWLEAEVTWSIEVRAKSDIATWIAAWAVVGSQSLWSTLDFRQVDNPTSYLGNAGPPAVQPGAYFTKDEPLGMGNIGCVATTNGHHPVGVMIISEDDFDVTSIHVSVRKVIK